jgi:ornithine--oxo-acid transaminase
MNSFIDLEKKFGANNYQPLPVVLTKGKGIFVWDENGKKYFDMMCAYSAISFGHCNPKLVKALTKQANHLAVVSRAYYSEKLGPLLQRICELTGQDKALPMNSGAEAVETAIKAARKWAYTVKGIKENQAEIIVCKNNFHGRTITMISMSSEPQYRFGFGPLTPGFKQIPYGDAEALEKAITANTAAFLVEPIQGEAGIIVPPKGYLKQCEKICRRHNVLLICDEVQTGLGRTGKLLACEHEQVKPDGLTLGKALGGGLLPISLFLSKKEVMDVFTPGDHGSTFGGNPLAATVALTALNILIKKDLIKHSAELGTYFLQQLSEIKSPLIKDVRGKGLFIGIEVDTKKISARQVCLKLMEHGLLSKDTHGTVVRLVPALIITKKQIDSALKIIKKVFSDISRNI